MLTTWHPLSAKVGTNFADKQRLLAGSDHGVFFMVLMINLNLATMQFTF
jgi:hypothetical protein